MVIGCVILGSLFGMLSALFGLCFGGSWSMAALLYLGCGMLGLLTGAGLELFKTGPPTAPDAGCHKLALFQKHPD